jgi:phosphatidylglycerol:prolipoprotein diacylglycerol transferase
VTKLGFIELIQGHDPRFDLGLLEFFFTVILCASFALTWRKKVPLGSYTIVTALSYAPVRFAMDFLRNPATENGDTRYAGLTPAQYGCIGLFAFGIYMIFYARSLIARHIDLTESVRAPNPEPPVTAPVTAA